MAGSRVVAGDGARADRELTLKAAAELTGCSGKLLRRHIRDGRLRPASVDGSRLTVTLAALREAGLLPAGGPMPAPSHAGVADDVDDVDVDEPPAPVVAEKERAEKERAEKERAEKERAEKERAEKERAEKERAEKEQAEKERAEKEQAEKEQAEKERAEKEHAEKEHAEKERAEKERAEKERAREDRPGKVRRPADANVLRMESRRPVAPEEIDDLSDLPDDGSDELDERDIAEIEQDLDDLPASDAADEDGPGVPPDDDPAASTRSAAGRVVAEVHDEPVTGERGLVVTGSGSQWITATQMHDLMRLMVAEREARSSEWHERTETLYREIIDSQKARIASLEADARSLQDKLADALQMVPRGENVQALEQTIRDLRIELDRRDASRKELEHERDRLRDLTDRLRNDLSRAERRSLEMAEQLRRFRAQGPLERLLGREPDEK